MYKVIGYSAGIVVFSKDANQDDLQTFIASVEDELETGSLSITFGLCTQVIREICIDVYEGTYEFKQYRADLSVSLKK
jgi:hypothetical protein